MITAFQSAKLRACQHLITARDNIIEVRSYACFTFVEVRAIDSVLKQIDTLLQRVLPSNERE